MTSKGVSNTPPQGDFAATPQGGVTAKPKEDISMVSQFEQFANQYAAAGWRLFWTGPDKRPVGPWKDVASTDWTLLRATYRPGYCLAGTPPVGVFVLDVDGDEGRETLAELEVKLGPLPRTRTHRTQSGGLHLLFRTPQAERMQFQGRRNAPGLDGRAPGRGYVLLPPSQGDKGQYTVIDDAPIADLPPAWEEFLTRAQSPQRVETTSGGVPKVLVDAWAPGVRDALFVGCAGLLRKNCVLYAEAHEILHRIMHAAGDEECDARLAKLARTYSLPAKQVAGFSQIVDVLGEERAKEFAKALETLYRPTWAGCLAKWATDKKGNVRLAGHYVGYSALKRLFVNGALDHIGYDEPDHGGGGIKWFVWRPETGWTRCQSERELKAHLLQLMEEAYAEGESPSTYQVRELLAAFESCAQERRGLFRRVEDGTGKRIRFLNGTYHLDSMQLKPHALDDGFIPVINCEFDESATCPSISQFLRTLGPKPEYAELFEAVLAQIMYGENPAQRIVHLMGEGGTGKSTFANLCRLLLPKELTVEGRLERINDTHETSAFVGKRLITFSDPDRFVANVEVLKKLTGEDTLLANPKYEHPFSFRFTGNVLITSNHVVAPRNHCSGWERRYLLIPCNNVVPDAQRDPDYLGRVLAPELPGLVNLLLRKFRSAREAAAVLRNPTESAPSFNRDALMAREDADPLAGWVSESLVVSADPNDTIVIGARQVGVPGGLESFANAQAEELYPRYYEWCRARGYTPLNQGNFTKALIQVLRAQGWSGDRKRIRTKDGRAYILTHLKWVIEPTTGGDGNGGNHRDNNTDTVAPGAEPTVPPGEGTNLQEPRGQKIPGTDGGVDQTSGGRNAVPGNGTSEPNADDVPARPATERYRRTTEDPARQRGSERSDRERLPDQTPGSRDAGPGPRHRGLRDANTDWILRRFGGAGGNDG